LWQRIAREQQDRGPLDPRIIGIMFRWIFRLLALRFGYRLLNRYFSPGAARGGAGQGGRGMRR